MPLPRELLIPADLGGWRYQVPRGKAWRVPKEVAQVLADAVVASYQHDGQGGIVEINTPRYAYSIGL